MNSILFKDSFPWTNFTQFKKTISYFYCSCSQNNPFIYCNNICKACLFGKTGQITYITLDIVLTHRYITITHRLLYINHKYCVSDEYISTSAFHKHIFLPHDSHLTSPAVSDVQMLRQRLSFQCHRDHLFQPSIRLQLDVPGDLNTHLNH